MCWFSKQQFGPVDNLVRDELIARIRHYQLEIDAVNVRLEVLRPLYPQVEVLTELRGIALYTAMVILGELGDVQRFRRAKQVAAYAGLTPRVNQSGEHCYHDHISKQGSPWLRGVLIEAAMKLVQQDIALANFYQRIRKRSSAKISRVAAARKLAEICWKRLIAWERQHHPEAAVA